MSTNTHEFEVESKIEIDLYQLFLFCYLVNKEVNQPKFPAYIRIYKAMTSEVVYKIDVSANNSNITYVNKTLIFHIPDSNEWNIDKQYDIILDEGVLYSDNVLNSTAQNVSTFRLLKAAANDDSSVGTTPGISSTITNIETTESLTSSSSDNVSEMSQPTTTLRELVTGNILILFIEKINFVLSR